MSTASAAPTVGDAPANHGQCVKESPQPQGKGGRSVTAKSKVPCTPPTPPAAPAPLTCTENEDTPGTVTLDSAKNTVTVAGSGDPSAGSNLACATNIVVSAEDTVTFDYDITGETDVCGGGVPRVYVLINGTYYNTHNDAAGVINPGCLPGSVTYAIPEGGTITEVAFIYDRQDTGSVTYSNAKIDGVTLDI